MTTAISPSIIYTTVDCAFGDIVNSVVADLVWYVDGVEVSRNEQQLLVEGSTVSYDVAVDPTQAGADTTEVQLEVKLSDGESFTASTMGGSGAGNPERDGDHGQTEEIPSPQPAMPRCTANPPWDSQVGTLPGGGIRPAAGI